jgi:hypothetical protein
MKIMGHGVGVGVGVVKREKISGTSWKNGKLPLRRTVLYKMVLGARTVPGTVQVGGNVMVCSVRSLSSPGLSRHVTKKVTVQSWRIPALLSLTWFERQWRWNAGGGPSMNGKKPRFRTECGIRLLPAVYSAHLLWKTTIFYGMMATILDGVTLGITPTLALAGDQVAKSTLERLILE